MTTTAYRLPRDVIPEDYDVELEASPARASFSGTLVMTAKVAAPTDRFELSARDLKVKGVIARAGKKKIKGKAKLRPDRETVELRFEKELPRGGVEVELTFKGKLNNNMHGLYLAQDGKERAVVSQCEATDARAIFPCFDEPDLKATLKWTVITDPGLDVVTNGIAQGKRKLDGSPKRVMHRFKRTRVIPTYLAAVTIGKYESTEARAVSGIPCRVVAGVGKTDQTDFAQDVTAQVLPWYEAYFGHPYNYQKLDQVAVPGFDAGAMENVGAIFYRQNLLLMVAGTASWFAQKRIAEVIAHEIAHQWFGNLVTMKWWDDLWLNEAFATWIAFKAVDEWQPRWRMWDDYLESKEGALSADALRNTHPVYTPVTTPAEATELFDLITYEKGCSVLRMAERFLGSDAFRDGIRAYIGRFENGNAAGNDLWTCLAQASGQPVDALMQSWVTQSGFPLLSVRVARDDAGTTLHTKQQRFFASQRLMGDANDQVWEIPAVIGYEAGGQVETFRTVLRRREETVRLPAGAKPRWIYPNAGATGFYRVHLDREALQALLDGGLSKLLPAERKSLLEDQWALVRAGLSPIDQFLDVLAAFRGEDDYLVARAMVSRLGVVDQWLVQDKERPGFGELVRWLFAGTLRGVGWDASDGEGPERAVLRAAVVDALGDLGRDPAVLDEAERRFGAEVDDPASVEPNLAGTLAGLAAQRGDPARLARFVEIYQARKKAGAPPQLQARYLDALARFESPAVVSRVLELCLDGTVPQEQLRLVLIAMLLRRASQVQTWETMSERWDEIGPKVGAMGVSRLVEATGSLPLRLRPAIEEFFTSHPVEEAQRAVQKALEAMELRRELTEREGERLGAWLDRARAQASRSA